VSDGPIDPNPLGPAGPGTTPAGPGPGGAGAAGAGSSSGIRRVLEVPLPIARPAFATAAVAALVVFVSTFLPWFTFRLAASATLPGILPAAANASADGTDAPMLGTWTLLLALAAAALLVLMVVRPDPRLWLGLPLAGLLIVVLALISLSRVNSAADSFRSVLVLLPPNTVSAGSGIGLWLTLLGGLGLIAAGVLVWRDQRGGAVAASTPLA
jgi:hypothetical protein